jgi:heme A synthase
LLALLVVICQAVVGGVVVMTDMQLISTLLHAALMAILFLVLCEGCRVTLPPRARSGRTAPARADAPLTNAPAD